MASFTSLKFYIAHVHCNPLFCHGKQDQVTDSLTFWRASCELTHHRFLSSMNSKRHTHATWSAHPTFKSTTTECKEGHRSTTNLQKDTQAVESSEYQKQQSWIQRKFQTLLNPANIKAANVCGSVAFGCYSWLATLDPFMPDLHRKSFFNEPHW